MVVGSRCFEFFGLFVTFARALGFGVDCERDASVVGWNGCGVTSACCCIAVYIATDQKPIQTPSVFCCIIAAKRPLVASFFRVKK